jgi:glucose-6-phosphate isomerase
MTTTNPRQLPASELARHFDSASGFLSRGTTIERRLSDLRGCFVDDDALERELAHGDPVVYSVTSVELGEGEGDLHYGMGTVMPGTVGAEYFLTKGHFHSKREAAEIYIGLSGAGALILEDESGFARTVPFGAGAIVTVPGNTAHRTINSGTTPLVYLGVYSAHAGHDYAAIATNNFALVAVRGAGGLDVRNRSEYRRELRGSAA